jgi:hypothetical protein
VKAGRLCPTSRWHACAGQPATGRGGAPDYDILETDQAITAVRKNLRNVVEHVTVADIANASLPDPINLLADDPEAWVTR